MFSRLRRTEASKATELIVKQQGRTTQLIPPADSLFYAPMTPNHDPKLDQVPLLISPIPLRAFIHIFSQIEVKT